jgi:hypothetical protein
VDFDFLKRLRYAGDGYLWKCFATASEPTIARAQIGGFRIHRGQISGVMADYQRELMSFCRRPSLAERLQAFTDRAMWSLPEPIKGLAGGATVIAFDHASQSWKRVGYREARRYR